MQLTVTQIISLSRAKLLEQTTEVVSDETLLIYANLAQQDIIKRTFTNDKILSATVSFTSGVGPLPVNFGTLYGSAQTPSGSVFEEVSIEDFDNKTLDQMITVESATFKVYPTSTTTLNIKYYPETTTLTAGSTPSVNDYFHECIVYGILSRAFEDLQDESLSAYYAGKYEAMLKSKSENQSNYEEGNQRGGQMFTYQQLI
jgi:lipopolysaccharide export LptBFGC system permease protein LptF